jgi:hypothetical protein
LTRGYPAQPSEPAPAKAGEGRFFHGYYDCYCYLPLYVFCGRHLLAARLRRSNIDGAAGAVEEVARIVGQIRRRWPRVRILLRADSGFCREDLMIWCEANRVDYLFGLAKNARLIAEIGPELAAAQAESERTGRPARRFKDFTWSTLKSWGRTRRVVGKAEWTQGEANPRFVVTSLTRHEMPVLPFCPANEHNRTCYPCRLGAKARPLIAIRFLSFERLREWSCNQVAFKVPASFSLQG